MNYQCVNPHERLHLSVAFVQTADNQRQKTDVPHEILEKQKEVAKLSICPAQIARLYPFQVQVTAMFFTERSLSFLKKTYLSSAHFVEGHKHKGVDETAEWKVAMKIP